MPRMLPDRFSDFGESGGDASSATWERGSTGILRAGTLVFRISAYHYVISSPYRYFPHFHFMFERFLKLNFSWISWKLLQSTLTSGNCLSFPAIPAWRSVWIPARGSVWKEWYENGKWKPGKIPWHFDEEIQVINVIGVRSEKSRKEGNPWEQWTPDAQAIDIKPQQSDQQATETRWK